MIGHKLNGWIVMDDVVTAPAESVTGRVDSPGEPVARAAMQDRRDPVRARLLSLRPGTLDPLSVTDCSLARR